MPSDTCARAVSDANRSGNALLKFITPNNVGLTGSHECGYYLPKGVWEMYSMHPPGKGAVKEHVVRIEWHDGRLTESRVKWYGDKTRSEYRLTRFGRGFPWLQPENIGSLLVLVIESHYIFRAYVLETEEDIEEIASALGVDLTQRWGVYRSGAAIPESEEECVERLFASFATSQADFPSGDAMAEYAREALVACIKAFGSSLPDAMLLRCIRAEYRLFQVVEHALRYEDVKGPFKSVDEFVAVANSILNSRKSRAGRSLENHVEYLLGKAGIPYDMRPSLPGKPDIVIPGATAYRDPSFPDEKLCVVGVKTTCKDRWRQVLEEAPRVTKKHILTVQPSISSSQLALMRDAGLTLIVPKELQKDYPKDSGMPIVSVETFIREVKARLIA